MSESKRTNAGDDDVDLINDLSSFHTVLVQHILLNHL